MINLNLYLKELKRLRNTAMAWIISLIGLITLLMFFYPVLMEGDMLKSGKTFQKPVAWKKVGTNSGIVITQTETQDLKTSANYAASKVIAWEEDDGSTIGVDFEKVQTRRSKTVQASVYKKATSENGTDKFLFSKAYTIAEN